MNEDDNSIRIVEELMRQMRRLALEREVSVSDIIHEALGEFIYMRETGFNYFDIIHSIEENVKKAEHFVVAANVYDFVVSVKSPLQYVHRPTLRYEIKIIQNNALYIGKMSVALRTHDINTLRSFSDFLNLWIQLENKYIMHRLSEQIEYSIDAGYFERKIYLPAAIEHISGQTVGAAVGDYIHAFDGLFKHYFYHPDCGSHEIEDLYAGLVKDGKLNI